MPPEIYDDGWETGNAAWKEPAAPNPQEMELIKEAKHRYKSCEEWEAQARILFEYDYKFANGDTHNKYQWDNDLVTSRELVDKPCLTINKTQVHNLMVVNDAKQNKPGIRIRPVGEEASYEGAQIFQELIYHIEYISNAENVYDSATTFQVEAGIGYWRVCTEYISDDSFNQEVYIRRIKDPRSVYLDPNINEVDGSDARFGYIFEDMPKDLFKAKHPDFASIAGSTTLGNVSTDGWLTKDNIRVAEYYRKEQNKDKLVTWINDGAQIIKKASKLDALEKAFYGEIKKHKELWEEYRFKERKIVTDDIKWFKIAGDRVIDSGPWLGKYIPIVRLVGTETVIDGILDRKGHTRALINAQQIYNYNTSANVEYGALQTKAPWVAATEAIEGYEEYYKNANTQNYSYLPYNSLSEDGKAIPAPTRPTAPQASPAYVEQMKIAQNEMMMVTGQYQSQLGENENAKSGIAINARQRQGDKATYHFIDNQAIAIRFTGKILIDLVPKIYDTKRVMQITAINGSIINLTVDPNADKGYEKVDPAGKVPQMVKGQQVQEIIFNPNFGLYDIQSDTGPSFATRRQEAFNALTQIAAQNKEFMNVGGDLLWKVADFPEADILAERWRKIIPPNILGEGLPPGIEETMHKAADHIQLLTGQLTAAEQELKSKDRDLNIRNSELQLKNREFVLNWKVKAAEQARLDYDAETKRLVALGNAGPGVSVEQTQPIVVQLLSGMLAAGEPGDIQEVDAKDLGAEQAHLQPPTSNGGGEEGDEEQPPVEGARKAGDGNWYVKQENGYARVEA